jgi:hypothetical protein
MPTAPKSLSKENKIATRSDIIIVNSTTQRFLHAFVVENSP